MIPPPLTNHGVVVALGGNALLPEDEAGEIHQQFAHTRESLAPIVDLARSGWRIAIVHGNGPQIGDELYRNEMARAELPPLPTGVLVAGTAGWIGYMIQQSLQNALEREGVERDVVTVITQVLVDPADPSLKDPSKPIGRTIDAETARVLKHELGWAMKEERPNAFRRLMPSPKPIGIVEKQQIRDLVDAGTIVIACGGGGTPVYRDPVLRLEGVDAVIDKDRAAAVLASEIHADVLLILTNVDGVYRDFGSDRARLEARLTTREASELLASGALGRGSMAPKVEAAMAFVSNGGKRAHIARLDRGQAAIEGREGTMIVP